MMALNDFFNFPNGTKMPRLGLGTSGATDLAVLESALNSAFDCGYRHIDTAFSYKNENLIGEVLQKWLTSGKAKRNELFITTKLPSQAVHKDRVEMFLNKSLSALKLDYIDLYLIHFPVCGKYIEGRHFPLNENGEFEFDETDHVSVWKKMEEQVNVGKVKAIGLSNFNIKQISKILEIAKIKPACLQIELHVYLQQKKLVEFCKSKGIAVVAFSPLGCPGRNRNVQLVGSDVVQEPKIMEDPTLKKIAEKHSKTEAQIMLKFLLQSGISAIPKSIKNNRLKENINVYDFQLDPNDMNTLQELDKGEAERVFRFTFFKGVDKHPEFPLTL